MSRRSRILLYSCHGVAREALAAHLSSGPRFSVAVAERPESALAAVRAEPPDLLLIDINRAKERLGCLVRETRQMEPAPKVVVLGLPLHQRAILRCVEAGVDAFVGKENHWGKLVDTLDRVLQGEVLCSTDIADSLFTRLADVARQRREHDRAEVFKLTPREIEILQLIADDSSNRQIAEQLNLSVYTVKNHVHHIFEKLEVGDRGAAVRHAYRHGWIRDRRHRLVREAG